MPTLFDRIFVGVFMGAIGLSFVGSSVFVIGFLTYTLVYIPLAILYLIDERSHVLPIQLSGYLEKSVLWLIEGVNREAPVNLVPFLLCGCVGTFFMWRKAKKELARDKEKELQEETMALRGEESAYLDLLTHRVPWRQD